MILKSYILSKHFYLFILIASFISCQSGPQKKEDITDTVLTNITFKNQTFNFGKIPAEKRVKTVFEFSNTGKKALLIKEVRTSCGCTVPKWSKEKIAPNDTGEVSIVYDAKYPGRFNKTIVVTYNGKDSPIKLTITGEVPYPAKEKKESSKNP